MLFSEYLFVENLGFVEKQYWPLLGAVDQETVPLTTLDLRAWLEGSDPMRVWASHMLLRS